MAPAGAAGMSSGVLARTPREVVEAHGGMVPNYNIFGQHHHRYPHKDKGRLVENVEAKADWQHEPKHRSRSEMHAKRRAAACPDISYDIDGDGAVGPTDYFIAKHFSKEQDMRLNTAERQRVVDSLESGMLDHYSFGHEAAGTNKAGPIIQKRGVIVTGDNQADLNEMYPPHPRSSKEPRFRQGAEMQLARRAEARQAAVELYAGWEASHPVQVPEPAVHQENMVQDPQYTAVSQRREAHRQAAREEAGMHPTSTSVNPERESREVGLQHVEQPRHVTRTSLNESRRVQRIEDLQETRRRATYDYIPHNSRFATLEHEEFESRRPPEDAMTLTKLKWQRKREGIEHNMCNFRPEVHAKQDLPKYSERDDAWWTLRENYVHEPPTCALRELREPEQKVAEKVTAVAPPAPKQQGAGKAPVYSDRAGQNPHAEPKLVNEFGNRTVKRWSTEFVPPGLPSRVPRIFDGVVDGIKQASTFSGDAAPLHRFSSFKSIREGGGDDDATRQRGTAEDMGERARQWKNYTMRGPDSDNSAMALFGPANVGASPGVMSPSLEAVPALDLGRQISTRGPRASPGLRAKLPLTVPHAHPLGDDPPMTERLDRMTRRKALTAELTQATPLESPRAPQPQTARERGASPGLGGAMPQPPAARSVSSRRSSLAAASPLPWGGPAHHSMVVRTSGFQWVNQQEHVPVAHDAPPLPSAAHSVALTAVPSAAAMSRSSSRRSKARLP